MSLINQVLEDLDKRRLEETSVTDVDDLHYTKVSNKSSGINKIVFYSMLGIVIAVATVFAYLYYYDKPASQKAETSTTNPPVPTASTTVKPESVKNNVEESTATPIVAKTVPAKKLVTKKIQPVPVVNETDIAEVETAEVIDDSAEPGTPFKKQVLPLRTEQRAELSYQTGYDQLKAKRYNQAEQSLRQALAVEPDHIKARELLSGIYIQQGRWVEASELLRKGVDLIPGHKTFIKLYARSLMQLNHDVRAIKVLEQNQPRIQDDPNHFAILAALYQRQGNHTAAADTYASILKVNSGNGVWWVGLGISLEAMGRNQEASQSYAHARKTGNLQAEVARFANHRLHALEEMHFPVE